VASAVEGSRLADRVLGATAAAAADSGRADVAWVLALAPRPVPFYVRLGAALAADPDLDGRLREVLASLTAALGHPPGPADPVAVTSQFVHRIPATAVARPTVDVVVELLVAARRRGPHARGLVEAAVGLLARLDRAPATTGACHACSTPAAPPGPLDTARVTEARDRQARIDGTRTAVALLTELQSYPPPARDPGGIWRDLADVARSHGVGPIGERGETVALDPERHELLDDPDDLDDRPGEADGPDGGTGPRPEVAHRPVRIVRSGYTWAHGEEVVVLQRALVRLVDRG
jgi:hypothetical protein